MAEIKIADLHKYDNKIVWICDYRYNDFDNKPIRNIKPLRVMVRNNDLIKKNIYYSSHHFVELNKKDEPIASKIFAPYDNTGYRTYTGVPLRVFETEEEAQEGFAKLAEKAYSDFLDYRKRKLAALQALDAEISSNLPTMVISPL